jgi:hypothetical protein
MLRSSGSAVERSGAAHGLSEVLMAIGADRIEMLLPDILTNAGNQDLKVFKCYSWNVVPWRIGINLL